MLVTISFWRARVVEKGVDGDYQYHSHDNGANSAVVSKTSAAAGGGGKRGQGTGLPDEEAEAEDDEEEDIVVVTGGRSPVGCLLALRVSG